jgi:hypothetical protein
MEMKKGFNEMRTQNDIFFTTCIEFKMDLTMK